MSSEWFNQKSKCDIPIGKKSLNTYVLAALRILTEKQTCCIKARGRSISQAVDVACILERTYNRRVTRVKLYSELMVRQDEGRQTWVSCVAIQIEQ